MGDDLDPARRALGERAPRSRRRSMAHRVARSRPDPPGSESSARLDACAAARYPASPDAARSDGGRAADRFCRRAPAPLRPRRASTAPPRTPPPRPRCRTRGARFGRVKADDVLVEGLGIDTRETVTFFSAWNGACHSGCTRSVSWTRGLSLIVIPVSTTPSTIARAWTPSDRIFVFLPPTSMCLTLL